ncbi:MAG: hypothetical protein KBC96_15495 [Armatimonadetes bacterium]|nr:hypothetical protein [Armatimonadota bacterium]
MAKAKAPQPVPQRVRKEGYHSDSRMDLERPQTIEELTGGRIRKKSK